MVLLSASTNPPKIADLPAYIAKLNSTNVDYIHCDIMDGHFVTAKTFSHKTVALIHSLTQKPLDVHLMTAHPERIYKKYIRAGATILTVHYEAFKSEKALKRVLADIQKRGSFAGVSFRPDTPVSRILPLLPFCDVLLVMSVVPGESGQIFLPETYARLDEIDAYLRAESLVVVIEVDGGVNLKNLPELYARDVTMVAMGTALFSSQNIQATVDAVRAFGEEKKPKSPRKKINKKK
jgi:ribulose-phosphate 3-epimerase